MKGKNIKCPHCEYEWTTMSLKKHVTCPDCLRKVNIRLNKNVKQNE